jgi:hypothetical protein
VGVVGPPEPWRPPSSARLASRSRPRARRRSLSTRSRLIWFATLLSAVCFEGLGRRFLPQVPAVAYYFAKDACLVIGLVLFGLRPAATNKALRLFAPFPLALAALCAWALVEVAHPAQPSLWLGLFGLRSYALWWLAPVVVASALRNRAERDGALAVLSGVAVVVALFALFQFSQPADAQVNIYSQGVAEGSQAMSIPGTGRPRVTSTFSYITGFADFVGLAPGVLLALGLQARARWLARLAFAAVALSVAAAPASGSRGALIVAASSMLLVFAGAGLLATRGGRRVFAALVAAAVLALVVTPAGVAGVQQRFQGEDTASRLTDLIQAVPLYPLFVIAYPPLGVGTGMQQNVRASFGVATDWASEGETGRVLIELGLLGYLFMTLCRVGLLVALLRLARQARRAKNRGLAGGAVAYAALALTSSLVFDHVSQALFFINVGLLLASLVAEAEAAQSAAFNAAAAASTSAQLEA